MAALLTGSRVYGTPREDSDIDLVVLMSPREAWSLASAMKAAPPAEETEAETAKRVGPRYPTFQFRAGRLNVIVETDSDGFEIWRRGTAALAKMAPVTRDQAVALFKRLRAEAEKEAEKEDRGNPGPMSIQDP